MKPLTLVTVLFAAAAPKAIGQIRLGRNTIAVHVRQMEREQYIDVGLVDISGL